MYVCMCIYIAKYVCMYVCMLYMYVLYMCVLGLFFVCMYVCGRAVASICSEVVYVLHAALLAEAVSSGQVAAAGSLPCQQRLHVSREQTHW